jgi:signal transduction histidine kinase
MTMDFNTLAELFPLLLLLLGLGLIVAIDPYILRVHRHTMLVIVGLCLTLVAQNLMENELFVSHSNLALKSALSAYGYSVRPVLLVLFLRIVQPDRSNRIPWGLAAANALLYCLTPFTGLCFSIRDGDYAALRGPLWFSCFAVSGILLVELLVLSINRYRETRRLEQLIPLTVAAAIVASVVLDFNVGMAEQPISFLTMAIVVGSLFYYIWLHLQFVREHERDLMATQRIQIMMTQIQPHFLFNTLNTIRALYAKDPPLADKTLESFSLYLRQNLESLSQSDLIPVTRDLEHTRLYTQIEMLRFPNVRVEYHIEDDTFDVPALTIQPLVENAIRHGVRSRTEGLVRISTSRQERAHQIEIRDNGVGFDPNRQAAAGVTHIGIANVRDRIERMCGGTMSVQSEVEKGTCVTLQIPDASMSGERSVLHEGNLRGR